MANMKQHRLSAVIGALWLFWIIYVAILVPQTIHSPAVPIVISIGLVGVLISYYVSFRQWLS